MTIRLLGTGAAHGIPAFWSDSRVSKHARQVGGREIRTRSAALLDGCIKIDLGPDTLCQLNRDRLDARDWSALIFTHGHDDHFIHQELQYFLFPFNDQEIIPFPIYANNSIARRLWDLYPDWPMEVHITASFCPFQIGNYTVHPLRANHKLDEDSQLLLFEKNGKTILYGTDTGKLFDETVDYLRNFELDCLIIECTDGRVPTEYYGHLDLESCIETVNELRSLGILRSNSAVVTTHHSDQGDLTYSELVEALNPHGITAGYDGIEITV
jgi:phosphoribosyl 1,2-cyclic phosphate phosphodiesterase